MNQLRMLNLALLFFFLIQPAFAQKATPREWNIFRKGVDDYLSKDYDSAEKNFSLVISKLPDNNLLTANHLMLAKTKYKQGRYQESLTFCNDFIRQFPNSRYVYDIYYLKGNNHYRLRQYDEALTNWLLLVNQKQNPALRQKALRLAEDVVRYRLNEPLLYHLKNTTNDAFTRNFISYHLAENYYDKGNAASALMMLEELKSREKADFIYADKVNRLYEMLKNKKSKTVRIAALLPLSGDHEQFGKQLLNGVRMAVEEYNRLPEIDIEIIPFDYETRLITALIRFKEIARDPSIIAVFGPIESDITAACAALADYEGLPLIAPVTSENQLTNLSNNVFQLAPPIDIIASNLIDRAVDSLQVKRVATLSPIDDYFIEMTQAFIRNHLENGGEVVAEQWYYPGDKDFSKQFKQLKRIGLKLTFQDSVLAEDPALSPQYVDSLYKAYVQEQKELLIEKDAKIDSTNIPVHAFDALFIPVYKEDINLIAPQFAYSNIQAQVLGNADWYEPEALKKNRNYINGLIFITDGYINEENWDYRQFRNNFRLKYQTTPEKFDLIGFDSFNYILSTLSQNNQPLTRTSFSQLMKRGMEYRGIYRHFTMGPERYNRSTRLLKFVHGVIIPLY